MMTADDLGVKELQAYDDVIHEDNAFSLCIHQLNSEYSQPVTFNKRSLKHTKRVSAKKSMRATIQNTPTQLELNPDCFTVSGHFPRYLRGD